MSNPTRRTKSRFRSDGTSVWTKRKIDGPGVWVTCIKGKERQAIGETYDLFETLAEELWPPNVEEDVKNHDDNSGPEEMEEDLEKIIAKEVEIMKRPRKEKWFASCHTETPCLIFISCKPPVDPVLLVNSHMKKVEETGVTHTRSAQRLIPVTGSCDANLNEITSLCKRIVSPAFANGSAKAYRYKVELRMRSHSKISRDDVILTVAQSIPAPHIVDLSNPELFVLVEIFKATCGISVVRDYYKFKKFNVVEVAQMKHGKRGEVEEIIQV